MWLVGVWNTNDLYEGGEPFELDRVETLTGAENRVMEFVGVFRGFRYSMKASSSSLYWTGRSTGGRSIVIQAMHEE